MKTPDGTVLDAIRNLLKISRTRLTSTLFSRIFQIERANIKSLTFFAS